MSNHSAFLLPRPTVGGLCLIDYARVTPRATVFPYNSTSVTGNDLVTIATIPEHRSFAERQTPPRALIELARRCGLLAAVEAHDAGMSTPVLAVRQETHL